MPKVSFLKQVAKISTVLNGYVRNANKVPGMGSVGNSVVLFYIFVILFFRLLDSCEKGTPSHVH